MTKIVDLSDVLTIGLEDESILVSKNDYNSGWVLIAQTDKEEQWFDIKIVLNPPYLKTGYTMYILTKHIK
jgi:hypothetical protein